MLHEITRIMFEVDPMKLHSSHDDEYDSESVSIVARMMESGLFPTDVAEEREIGILIVDNIIRATLQHWFDDPTVSELELSDLSTRLYDAYVTNYPLLSEEQ